MAFAVVEQCLDGISDEERDHMRYVYCSRYGEYPRSFDILWGIVNGETTSPTAFSNSVHNTAASQIAIHRKDQSPFIAIAACETCLENAFVEAWTQTNEGHRVMLIYHDQQLPDLYRDQPTSVRAPLALAILLSKPHVHERNPVFRLDWRASELPETVYGLNDNTVLPIIRLLAQGGSSITHDTGRVAWTWTRVNASD